MPSMLNVYSSVMKEWNLYFGIRIGTIPFFGIFGRQLNFIIYGLKEVSDFRLVYNGVCLERFGFLLQ